MGKQKNEHIKKEAPALGALIFVENPGIDAVFVEEMHARQKSQFVAFVQRSKADTEIVLVGYFKPEHLG